MARDLLGSFFVKNAAEKLREYMDPSGIDDITGLRYSKDFFKLAGEKLESGAKTQWAVVSMDIEHFKLFNDWYGRSTGDYVLMQIGNVLQMVEKSSNALACYMMQDNFCILIQYDEKRIERIYDQIKRLVSQQGNQVGFMPAFGVCKVESNDEDIMDLYDKAEIALGRAKKSVNNRIVYYDKSMLDRAEEEYRVLFDFHQALEEGHIKFYLQPQCRASKGTVVGAEALARWQNSDGSFVSPGYFIPVLENYGFVTTLDEYIWEKVCEWLRKMIDEGYSPVPVSVNVSRVDIYNIDVPAAFKELVDRFKLPPSLLKIEITETAYAQDMDTVEKVVYDLRSAGFSVLMDDFGSGYSSLNMLRHIDMDIIKIDAQFLKMNKEDEKKSMSILESIINISMTMALPIIVEGVETKQQVAFLKDLGCRYMQGYYFYKPMSVEDFEELLKDTRKLDLKGLRFKTKNKMHVREFLDENIYSDSMLNNILGAVSYYL
ncbi:MAG: bifunctional diguanylate cyclase/phosphodiesterase, partial [Lachnospiraceae bacterium]|nr:bifunctional diguanylate cyclase/phosphodiesterase [Lachnospiraceae bacterium]